MISRLPYFFVVPITLALIINTADLHADTFWQPINIAYPVAIKSLTIDPAVPEVFYAGTNWDGITKSISHGTSPNSVNSGLTNINIQALVINPINSQTIYAGTNGGGIFKSTNGGANWNTANTGLIYTNVQSLAIDPTNPLIIYAGTNGGGIFKSTNGGANWNTANTGLIYTNVQSLAIDPTNPLTIYVGTNGGGVFKSINGGINWVNAKAGLSNTNVLYLVIDPTTPQNIYAATNGGGVFKTTNSGTNWVSVNIGLTNKNVLTLAIDPTAPQTIYAGTNGGGVFKSTNSGTGWNVVNNGLTNLTVYTLAIDKSSPQVVYAGTLNGGFYTPAINGVCGAASIRSKTAPTTAPTANLCSSGTASTVTASSAVDSSGSKPWIWTCAPSNGGLSDSCLAGGPLPVVSGKPEYSMSCTIKDSMDSSNISGAKTTLEIYGQTIPFVDVSAINGGVFFKPLLANLGTLFSFKLTVEHYKYSTLSINDSFIPSSLSITCPSISLISASAPVNASCGTFNNLISNNPPTLPSEFCATGTPATLSTSSPWNWICAGLNGGSNSSCATSSTTPNKTEFTAAKVYLGVSETFTISNSGATIYGSAGNDTIRIDSGVTNVTLDQNIERIIFPSKAGDYQFKQTGNKINVYDATGTLVVTVPLQSSGTQLSFDDVTATALISAGVMTLGGATVNSTAIGSVTPITTTNPAQPFSISSTAKVYLGTNDSFTASNSGITVYGGSGNDTVTIAAGVSAVTLDQNVERINFSGTAGNYTFKQTGNKINIYNAAGALLLATAPVQGDTDGTLLGFSDGTASALVSGGVMTVGGALVSTTTAGAITPTLK